MRHDGRPGLFTGRLARWRRRPRNDGVSVDLRNSERLRVTSGVLYRLELETSSFVENFFVFAGLRDYMRFWFRGRIFPLS